MKKLLSMLLATALAFSLAAPALALEDLDPPLWQQWGYDSYEDMLTWWTEEEYTQAVEEEQAYLAWAAEYQATHADEVAAFDADAWFAGEADDGYTKEEYINLYHFTQEAFRAQMMENWLRSLYWQAQEQSDLEAAIAARPEAYARFDPDEWLVKGWGFYNSDYRFQTRQDYQKAMECTEEEFVCAMERDWAENVLLSCEYREKALAYEAAYPEEAAAFDADAWFTDEMGYTPETKADYMYAWVLESEEDFRLDMMGSYAAGQETVRQYREAWADLCTAQPERSARFLRELNGWLAQEYGYAGFDEFMAEGGWYSCPEEAYLDLFQLWNEEYERVQAQIEAQNSFITAHGGVPGKLGVMLNGTYLAFPDGRAPELRGGTAYADAATLSNALNVTLSAPEDGYVSVRAAAQTAGLTVYWDKMFETVVLLDPEAVAAKLDERFTVLNGALAKWTWDETKNYKTDLTLALDMTVFDSMDGDKSGSATLSASILSGPAGYQADGTYDILSLMEQLSATPDGGRALSPADKALCKGSFQLRADVESSKAYLRASFLGALAPLSGTDLTPGSWFVEDWDGAAPTAVALPTVGTMLLASTTAYQPVYLYDQLMSAGERAAMVLGDDCFADGNGGRTLHLDRAGLATLLGSGPDGVDAYGMPEQFDLKLTVRSDGTLTGSILYQSVDYGSYAPTVRVTADFTLSALHQKLTLEVHTRNVSKFTVILDAVSAESAQAPQTTPPKGTSVVEV